MLLSLKVVGGSERGREIKLRQGVYTIGRDANNPVQLDSPMVSRKHAEIRIGKSNVILKDLGGANGTLVNNQQIREQEIISGDKIFIGDYVLQADFGGEQLVNQLLNIKSGSTIDKIGSRINSGFLATVDWRIKVIIVVSLVLLIDHFAIARLFSDKFQNDVIEASLRRASANVRFLAEQNRHNLYSGNEELLDTDTIMEEEGVVGAFIANSESRILSPSFKLNQLLIDETSKKALQSEKNVVIRSEKLKGGIYRFATPIRMYENEKGVYRVIGVAQILFAPKSVASTIEAIRKMWLLAFTFVPLAALFIYLLVRSVTLPPIRELSDFTAKLFRGELERIDRNTPISPIRPLIDTVNAAAVRLREQDLADSPSIVQPFGLEENLDSLEQLKWLIDKLPNPTLAVDQTGMILALNNSAKAILEISETQPSGLLLNEIISNYNFKDFINEGMAELKGSALSSTEKMVEYGDFSYRVAFYAWPNNGDRVRQIILTIEKK